MDSIKILVADDHPMMREALIAALEDEPNLQVVGQAADGRDAMQLAATLTPDVILMDLMMPGVTGLEAIKKLQASHPQIKILVISSAEEEEKILAAIQAGALGFFPKTAPRPYLIEAVNKVADGIPYIPAGIAAKLFKSLRELKSPAAVPAVKEPLTARQGEILALLGKGCSDLEIANTLSLTESTVRSHVHHILQRLELESRSHVVAFANQQGKK